MQAPVAFQAKTEPKQKAGLCISIKTYTKKAPPGL